MSFLTMTVRSKQAAVFFLVANPPGAADAPRSRVMAGLCGRDFDPFPAYVASTGFVIQTRVPFVELFPASAEAGRVVGQR
jgi:hypothetical protein